jgi:hypothetical protein
MAAARGWLALLRDVPGRRRGSTGGGAFGGRCGRGLPRPSVREVPLARPAGASAAADRVHLPVAPATGRRAPVVEPFPFERNTP